MAETTAAAEKTKTPLREREKVISGTIIGSHGLDHIYGHGFLVILPELYTALGLTPFEAGLIGSVRRAMSGSFSMLSGIIVDMYQHHRGLMLGLSLMLTGLGYLLASWVPVYGVILMGLAIASAGSALWHPPALSILSQRFPHRRGFLFSLHRSAGSIGDTLAPVMVGALLLVMSWQHILRVAFPMPVVLTTVVLLLLWRVGGPKRTTGSFRSNLRRQFSMMGGALRGTGLIPLMGVSALRGLADRTLLFFLPLYLAEDLDKGSLFIGVHLALLTALAIVVGPLFGALSDKTGRKPVIIFIMAASIIAPPLIVLSGDTVYLTITIAALGAIMFSVNSLVQASALDIAEGKGLEGSFIGMLWGNNALFGALSPILAGALAQGFGFTVVFYYATGFYVIGTLASLTIPQTKGAQRSLRDV